MLTHEQVLKVFGPYLDADPDYEVVKTSRGYTLLALSLIHILKRDGVVSCHYCDSVGLQEIPGFRPVSYTHLLWWTENS